MCDTFAKNRLVRCPTDIGQRLEDGLNVTLSVLDPSCTPSFAFSGLMNDPIAGLPVVYSSSAYRSPAVVSTIVPTYPSGAAFEFWEGLHFPGVVMQVRTATGTFYRLNGIWTAGPLSKSTINKFLFSADDAVRAYKPDGTITWLRYGGPAIDALQISGNGETYFIREGTG